MNGNDDNLKLYSAAEIRRYTEGKMSPEEMHAIEKAALDDPFLADAIEGFDDSQKAHGVPKIDETSKALQHAFQKRLTKENKSRGVVPLRSWRTAVAAAVLVTAGILGYLVYEDKTANTVLSDNRPTATPAKDANVSRIPGTDSNTPLTRTMKIGDKQETAPFTRNEEVITNETGKPNAVNDRIVARAPTKSANEIPGLPDEFTRSKSARAVGDQESERQRVPDESPDTSYNSIAGIQPPVVLPDLSSMPASASLRASDSVAAANKLPEALQGKVAGISSGKRTSSVATNQNIFMGQVITEDERPLSNAVLKLADKRTYSTDNNGNFMIVSKDSVIEVEISMVGAEAQNFTLKQNPSLNRLILPDLKSELSEVVVVGYGTQRKNNKLPGEEIVFNAAPEGGWESFRKYLSENVDKKLKQIPPAFTQVSFRISNKNELSDFRFKPSVSPAHNQEAIRLIKNGPAWKVIKGKKATVTVTVVF